MDVEKLVLENIDAMACELRPVEYISNLVRAALAQDRKEREIKHAEGFAESFYQMCFGREKEEAIEWLRNAVSSLVRYEAGKSDLSARLERLAERDTGIPIKDQQWRWDRNGLYPYYREGQHRAPLAAVERALEEKEKC